MHGKDASLLQRILLALERLGAEIDTKQTPPAQYAIDLCTIAGSPPRLDVVHLGLGDDGHRASLVMGDPAARPSGEVAVTGLYAGVQRMTLTFRVLNLARFRVWLVCGQSKRRVVKRLLAGDTTMIAGRILRPNSILVVDEAVAG
jgi:6-phosphogluconolactonase/glucosamine-6-phosphate isomerase/deaminase